MKDEIGKAVELLSSADRVIAFVGAGMSQESGIPTFRGEDGMLNDESIQHRFYRKTYKKDPKGTLEFFKGFMEQMDVDPNPGHYALADLSQMNEFVAVTQNIDGLLEQAVAERGYDPIPVCHIHGTFSRVRCDFCFRMGSDEEEMGADCTRCEGLMRPDVVLYGEPLDDEVYEAAEVSAENADVCLLLGTSGMVYPAADIPWVAARNGATLIEVNPAETELSKLCKVKIRGKTGEVLTQLVEKLS